MRLIIHDLNSEYIKNFNFKGDDIIINTLSCKNNCIGCFYCWIKHPTKCIYKDKYSNLTSYLKKANEFIIISKSRYASYSKEIKQVI